MYSYVRNNPLRYTDPDGRDCQNGVSACIDYFIVGAKAVANLVPATATLVNRVFTGGLVGDAPMFQPSNVDQAQGMQAASVMMMLSPLAEAGAAAAVGAMESSAAAEVPQILQNAARGTASETRVLGDLGQVKNTTAVTSAEGKSIPDFINKTTIGEIKDVKNLSNTQQLRIQRDAAVQTGKDLVVVTGTNTNVTPNVAKSQQK